MLVLLNLMPSVGALTDINGDIFFYNVIFDGCRSMMYLRQNWNDNSNLLRTKGH